MGVAGGAFRRCRAHVVPRVGRNAPYRCARPHSRAGRARVGRNAPARRADPRARAPPARRRDDRAARRGRESRGAPSRRRVERGWLVPLHRGVYRIGPIEAPRARGDGSRARDEGRPQPPLRGRDLGASARPTTATSMSPSPPATTSAPDSGLRIHRSHSLNAAVQDGLPLTTPARTLQDLASHLPQHELDRAVEQAQVLRLATKDEIAAQRATPRKPRTQSGARRRAGADAVGGRAAAARSDPHRADSRARRPTSACSATRSTCSGPSTS